MLNGISFFFHSGLYFAGHWGLQGSPHHMTCRMAIFCFPVAMSFFFFFFCPIAQAGSSWTVLNKSGGGWNFYSFQVLRGSSLSRYVGCWLVTYGFCYVGVILSFLLKFVWFLDRVSLVRLGWPETHYIDQSGIKLAILLPLCHWCWDYQHKSLQCWRIFFLYLIC